MKQYLYIKFKVIIDGFKEFAKNAVNQISDLIHYCKPPPLFI